MYAKKFATFNDTTGIVESKFQILIYISFSLLIPNISLKDSYENFVHQLREYLLVYNLLYGCQHSV